MPSELGVGFILIWEPYVILRRLNHSRRGFTLIELMVAALILAILFMSFLSTLTGSFLADAASTTANTARVTAERLMEESLDLSYNDSLMLDQNALITDQGLACKIAVVEIDSGLALIEINVRKPAQPLTLALVAAMSIVDFRGIEAVSGSDVRLLCLKAQR